MLFGCGSALFQVSVGGSLCGASCSQVQGSCPGKYLYVFSGSVSSRCLKATVKARHNLSHDAWSADLQFTHQVCPPVSMQSLVQWSSLHVPHLDC